MKNIERARKGSAKLQAIFDKKMVAAQTLAALRAKAAAASAAAAAAANANVQAASEAHAAKAAAEEARKAQAAVEEAEQKEGELDDEMIDLIAMFGTKAEVSSHTPTYGGRRTRRSERQRRS